MITSGADTLKAKSRTKFLTLLRFWDWVSEVIAKDPNWRGEGALLEVGGGTAC